MADNATQPNWTPVILDPDEPLAVPLGSRINWILIASLLPIGGVAAYAVAYVRQWAAASYLGVPTRFVSVDTSLVIASILPVVLVIAGFLWVSARVVFWWARTDHPYGVVVVAGVILFSFYTVQALVAGSWWGAWVIPHALGLVFLGTRGVFQARRRRRNPVSVPRPPSFGDLAIKHLGPGLVLLALASALILVVVFQWGYNEAKNRGTFFVTQPGDRVVLILYEDHAITAPRPGSDRRLSGEVQRTELDGSITLVPERLGPLKPPR